MTNIGAVADAAFALRFSTKKHLLPQAAHRTPQGSFALCKSEASATMFYLRESEASAAKRQIGTEINHTFWLRANTSFSFQRFFKESTPHLIQQQFSTVYLNIVTLFLRKFKIISILN